jgi:hypothetical protein
MATFVVKIDFTTEIYLLFCRRSFTARRYLPRQRVAIDLSVLLGVHGSVEVFAGEGVGVRRRRDIYLYCGARYLLLLSSIDCCTEPDYRIITSYRIIAGLLIESAFSWTCAT